MVYSDLQFFYGVELTEENMYALLKQATRDLSQVEINISCEEDKQTLLQHLAVLDEGRWWADFQDEIHGLVEHLFKDQPVSLRMAYSGNLPFYQFWERPFLVRWEYDPEPDASFRHVIISGFQIDTSEWDRDLMIVCETFNLQYKPPAYHFWFAFDGDPDNPDVYGYRYEATLFYGIMFQGLDTSPFTKELLRNHWKNIELVDEDHSYLEDLLFPRLAPQIMQAYQESYDETTESWGIAFEELVNSVFESEEFANWEPDEETIQEIFWDDGTLYCLNKNELSASGVIFTRMYQYITGYHYVAIPESLQKADGEPFLFPNFDKVEWDQRIKAFCSKFNLQYEEPQFQVLRTVNR